MERDWVYPALVMSLTAIVLAEALKFATGFPGQPSGVTSLQLTVIIVTIATIFRLLRHLHSLWRAGEDHPIQRLRSGFWPSIRAFAPLAAGVAILGSFLHAITFLKSMITAIMPFWADAPLAALDLSIGISGNGLARALQPVITELGFFYGLWHAVHLGSIIWVLHWPAGLDKSRLIVGFMLTWAIGMALAYLFSSAGPIFTGRYDPMLAPESVRKVSHFLWSNYEGGGAILGGGISAFPSMHVALAAWFALALKCRGLAWIGWTYVAGVFACSVILGWHYTADGAAGIAIALVADRFAGLWIRRATIQQATATAAATGASTA